MVAIAGTLVCRSFNHFFSRYGAAIRVHPSRAFVALVAHSSTCDVLI